MPETVLILGAGATKANNGPLTNEILPDVIRNRVSFPNPESLKRLEDFLRENFHVESGAPPEEYPGLPLLMSLIDTAIDRRQDFHLNWNVTAVTELRRVVDLAIFDLLEYRLEKAPTNNHFELLSHLYPQPSDQPRIISMNYDVIADAAVMFLGQSRGQASGPTGWKFPDYGCEISTGLYRNQSERFGTLLKLHGSLNWLCCPTCHRLEIGASESRLYIDALQSLAGAHKLEDFYLGAGSKCETCQTELRALLVAPSHLKNYRNPHLTNVWYRAEQLLRAATHAVFVGYSLPDDDVEVVYLLKRGLAHLSAADITVIEFDKQHPDTTVRANAVGRRYCSLFGHGIKWSARGLQGWLVEAKKPPVMLPLSAPKPRRRRSKTARTTRRKS